MPTGNYGELRTKFLAKLRRRDCTDEQADIYLDDGISRVLRRLRNSAMETQADLAVDADGHISVPGDYLAMHDGLFYGDRKLIRLERGEFLQRYTRTIPGGEPVHYFRVGGEWQVGPNPGSSATIAIDYYAEPTQLVEDSDTSTLLDVVGDIFLVSALTYAADDFLDERSATWEAKYQTLMLEAELQYSMQEASEGYAAVSPPTTSEF